MAQSIRCRVRLGAFLCYSYIGHSLTNNLIGVMRFLQLEWHNHERARNAWDIERAEMKAKIAKQEGEVRSAKKLNEQLEKHVRMLENALKNERAKSKGVDKQSEQDKADAKGKERLGADPKRICKFGACPSR